MCFYSSPNGKTQPYYSRSWNWPEVWTNKLHSCWQTSSYTLFLPVSCYRSRYYIVSSPVYTCKKKVFSCTYFFCKKSFFTLYIESVDGLKRSCSQEAIYTVYFGFVSYMHCATSTPTHFLWMFWEFFTSFIGFSIQFLDTLRVHAFLSGKQTSDTLSTKCSRSFGTASKTGRCHCCSILL